MMSPSRLQAELPQLMKASVLPVGIGASIGTSKSMLVGRVSYFDDGGLRRGDGSPRRRCPPLPDVRGSMRSAVASVLSLSAWLLRAPPRCCGGGGVGRGLARCAVVVVIAATCGA